MLVRPAHAALLAACITCNATSTPQEPPAQPAELVSATASPPPTPPSDASPTTPSDHLDPERASRYRDNLTTGLRQQQAHDYPAAIDAFTAALADIPDDPRALAGRGHAHLQLGDTTAAARDLGLAITHASQILLAAQIHLDLARLAELRRDREAARKQHALAALYAPSATASTLCLADIRSGADAQPPDEPTTWLAIWTTHFEPSKANLKDPTRPADDPAARDRVCHYESLALDACAGPRPWVLRIPGRADPEAGIYTDQYMLVDHDGTGRLASRHLVDIDTTGTCEDRYDLAIVARDPLVVRTTHTNNALGEVCDDPGDPDCHIACIHERSDTRFTVHARDDLRLLLSVASPDRPDRNPLIDLKISPDSVTITGSHCDRTIRLFDN